MLENIIKNKIIEVENLKASTKYESDNMIKTQSNNYNFLSRLKNVSQDGSNPIIAEIKRKSPSKGNLDSKLDVKVLSKFMKTTELHAYRCSRMRNSSEATFAICN